MSTIKAWAAPSAGGALEPFEYDPGPLGRRMSRSPSSTAASATPTCRCSTTNGVSPPIRSCPATKRSAAWSRSAAQPRACGSASASASAGTCAAACTARNASPAASTCAASVQGTIVGHHGGFADRVRAHWVWACRCPTRLPAERRPAAVWRHHRVRAVARAGGLAERARGRVRHRWPGAHGAEVLQGLGLRGHCVHVMRFEGPRKHARSARTTWLRAATRCDLRAGRQFDLILDTVNASLDWNACSARWRPVASCTSSVRCSNRSRCRRCA